MGGAMSRGLVLGVLLGAGGATVFWRMKLAQRTLRPVAAPAPAEHTEPAEPANVVEDPTRSASTETVAGVRAEPVERTRAQPPETISPLPHATSAVSAAKDAKPVEQTGSQRPPTPPSTTPPVAGSPRPGQDAKNATLVNKFMTKTVIPKLHGKIKDLFRVDEGLKQVRTAEQTEKPQLFVKLGEACFAQLLVGLQAFCLLKLLIATKVSYATRHGKPKTVDKKADLDKVKQDIFSAVDKFLQEGLNLLVVRHARCLVSFSPPSSRC